ncbi:protein ANTI-SILENCING 1 [Arabidopsis lyrata subsp. lyrata]|uniref:protein ANTI-SILENCING 1 n=1 Tax=Arabidopsis lyrata subsp. lyrata TaxID=81972 RepID=UPI000A29AB0C|nr:protein ANTI-SILENCING 1 [Arabidopsis lyrata subsp. lyrata]XP_020878802.1 protein ANTI-SILENCING 1 [Arabidopsis lyrata subsp. lyrata]|eukprot:XP_020878800.1 protein ANTI-SILENCING 1 [Arabidopsis lyrata subsp. lyrata]
MEESVTSEGLEFKWGKKKCVGGKKKDVQFYESFIYDGDEYHLYDCVLVGDASEPDSTEPFIGMIIKIWEHANKHIPRKVKLLWFFKPSEIAPYLEGVPDVLANELFLASGEGLGLANINQLEAIGGKCSVLCISKDKRNPQPSDEKINSADFVFRRSFDVKSCKVVDTIDDKIAGVDVKFIFNRACSEKEATAVQNIEADVNGNSDSLKPNGPLASGSGRKIEDNHFESSDCKKSSNGCIQEKEKGHYQLATKKATVAEERSNKDSGSRGNHFDGKAQESEVKKQLTKQKSMPAEERYSNSFEASGSRIIHSISRKAQVNDVKKQLTKQKSMPAEERYGKELSGLDDRPLKKQKRDGSVTIPDGRNTTLLQNITSDGKKDTGSFKRPRDKVTIEEVPPEKRSFVKKRDLGVSVSEGKTTKTVTEKGLSKKPSFGHAEDKMLADDNERNYQVTEVCRRPDAGKSKWFRSLPWEESMREAEKKGTVVLLQNLDPTYTSDEVEDIVYSALNEQCEARMIERTSVTIPHVGEALVIFKTREVAERVIRRLDEGCLLLSSGRPLVASFAKITPPGKPSSFSGHIKLHKTQTRREMRDAVATSHCSQPNNLEFDMAMEWCLHQARHEQASESVSKRQLEEMKLLRINFKPKLP